MSGLLEGRRVLAIAPRLWPTWGAGSQRTTAFVEGFARAGAEVSARVVVRDLMDVEDRPAQLRDVRLDQIVDPLAAVPWQPMHVCMCLGMTDRLTRAHRRAVRLPPEPFDAVFSSGPQWSAVIAGSRLAHSMRVPHVVDMRDEWSSNPFQTKLGPLFHFLDRRRETQTLRSAAGISAPYADVLTTLAVRPRGLTRVIEHGCDAALIAQTVGATPRRDRGAPLRLVFGGARYGMINEDRFMRALNLAAPLPCDVELRLIGSTRPIRGTLPDRVIVVTRPQLSHSELMVEYARAHALLALSPEERGLGWIPSKTAEYLATGRPILGFGARLSALQLTLARAAGSWYVAEHDPAGLRTSLAAMAMASEEPRDLRSVREIRDWSSTGDEAASFLAHILNGGRCE